VGQSVRDVVLFHNECLV